MDAHALKRLAVPVVVTLALGGAYSSGSSHPAANAPGFHTQDGIRCRSAGDALTCTLGDGSGATVNAAGAASQLHGAPIPVLGAALASGQKWRQGGVECGDVPGKGVSCYAIANGHGFYMSTSGSNLF